jgi:hypothetical protein
VRSKVAALALVITGPAAAQIRFVQQANGSQSGDTLTVSFAQPVTDGNTVIAAVQSVPQDAVVSALGELSNAMELDGEDVGISTDPLTVRLGIFRLTNSKGGPKSFTFQGTGVTNLTVMQLEYSGIDPVAPLDSTACMLTKFVDFNGLLVTHVPGEVLLNAVVSNGTMMAADPAWTARGNMNGILVEELLPPPGSQLAWATGDGTAGKTCTAGYFPASAQKPLQLAPLQRVTVVFPVCQDTVARGKWVC